MIIFYGEQNHPSGYKVCFDGEIQTDMEEIKSIIKNIVESGELRSNISAEDFADLSCLRGFHYNPERYNIEEHDAKTLRAWFHNNNSEYYLPILKEFFYV